MIRIPFRHSLVLPLVAAVIASAAAPMARAQSVAHLAFSPACSIDCRGLLVTVDPDAGRVEGTRQMPAAGGLGTLGTLTGFYASPDSRYVVWSGYHTNGYAPVLTILDQATDTTVSGTMPVGEFLGNPRRLELYISQNQAPMALSPSGLRFFADFQCRSGGAARTGSISTDGRRVTFWCDREAIFDTATGAIIRTFPTHGASDLSPDGRSFYQVYLDEPLRRYDVDSGVEVASVALARQPGFINVDPRTGHVYHIIDAGATLGPPRFDVYDGQTLQSVRSTTVPGLTSTVLRWTFDSYRPRAYAVTRQDQTGVETYLVVDTTSMSIVQATAMQTFPNDPGRWVIGYRPTSPVGLQGQVTGTTVSLDWSAGTLEGAVVHHVLEVGTAPGLTDLIDGFDLGLGTTFSASGVPPGRYYVRVRAANFAGASAASNEVVVQVP